MMNRIAGAWLTIALAIGAVAITLADVGTLANRRDMLKKTRVELERAERLAAQPTRQRIAGREKKGVPIAARLAIVERARTDQIALLSSSVDTATGRMVLTLKARTLAALFSFADRLRADGGFSVRIERHSAVPEHRNGWEVESALSVEWKTI
jgi:hypothetical protein